MSWWIDAPRNGFTAACGASVDRDVDYLYRPVSNVPVARPPGRCQSCGEVIKGYRSTKCGSCRSRQKRRGL